MADARGREALTAPADEELAAAATALEGQPALEVLRWAADRFAPRLTFATSLDVEGCILLDLIARNGLAVDVFSLDTGVLFPETYELWNRIEAKYGITIRRVQPLLTLEQQAAQHGPALWERTPDVCCGIRKVEPLKRQLAGFDAWITAIRRDQTPDRAGALAVERDLKFGLIKVSPLLGWTSKDVWRYALDNEVPYNPLHDQNYPSIGCQPCTSPVMPGEDPRSGRWRGTVKTECGLHSR